MGALHDEGLRSQPGLHQPQSLHEAWALKSALGNGALYVSGGTLLRTQWDAGTVPMPQQLIDLRGVAEMGGIRSTDLQLLSLGSLAPLSLCRKNEHLQLIAPAVQEAARVIAAPAVRNLATIGGNMASGFGDILSALLLYDAVVVSYDGKFLTSEPIKEWLDRRWEGARSSTEIVVEIRISSSDRGSKGAGRMEVYRKVGRREAFTPSLVTVGMAATIDADCRLSGVRIAAGGGSGRPQRLGAAEALLEGNLYGEWMLPVLYEAVVNDFDTYSDPFASDVYKQKTAGNLIVSELWKACKEKA